jgi:NAD(P)-dependent dehydrogenase (short-subunit alcohol dehydrogenase family)|tara:strand:- start:2919 stop:3650 length:732 start_codon:yes stop_codon:yes gene_type:complete
MNENIIILTGGSRGIGHATSKKFWEEGWRVITCSRTEVAPQCPWEKNKTDHFQIDLEDLDDLRKKVKDLQALLKGKPVKALINNAAISPKNEKNNRLNFDETDVNLWQKVFNVNFFSPIILSKSLIPNLQSANGVIINITSIASDMVHEFAGPAYATSKAALKSLTREMASDLSQYNIRVNAIAPGEIETSMITKNSQHLIKQIPMGRFGKPEEVASVIFSMCSESFSYVNGTEIQINGGQTV